MTWLQHYNPLGNLGLSALVAAVPLFFLLFMLGIRRSKGHHRPSSAPYPRSYWPFWFGARRWPLPRPCWWV